MAGSCLSQYGHHGGLVIGILVIVLGFFLLHGTGILPLVMLLGILFVGVSLAVTFFKRYQHHTSYGELPITTTTTTQLYSQQQQDYSAYPPQQEPYQAGPEYRNYPPQPAHYQQAPPPSYQSTPYAPPGPPRAYNY